MSVSTSQGKATIDGKTSYADLTGAAPGQSLTLTLANYEIPSGAARGVLQPTGLQAGQAVVVVTATAPEIVAGIYRPQSDANAGDKKVNFFSIWTADGRALPTADHALELMTVAADRVCGRLLPAAGSNGATASGVFTAKRIDTGPTTRVTQGGPSTPRTLTPR